MVGVLVILGAVITWSEQTREVIRQNPKFLIWVFLIGTQPAFYLVVAGPLSATLGDLTKYRAGREHQVLHRRVDRSASRHRAGGAVGRTQGKISTGASPIVVARCWEER